MKSVNHALDSSQWGQAMGEESEQPRRPTDAAAARIAALRLVAARIQQSRQCYLMARAAGNHARSWALLTERAALVYEWELLPGGTDASRDSSLWER